jgi:hydroxyquinol 1,2-dioxygenase
MRPSWSSATHLFERGDQYLDSDVVYGVKEPLIVDFQEQQPGRAPNGEQIGEPWYLVEYDFVLKREEAQAVHAA